MSSCILSRGSCIQKNHASVPWKIFHILCKKLLQSSLCNILDHKACHVYRIFRGRIRRRVRQIQFLQLKSCDACIHGSCKHINPLIHTVIAYDLRTQQLICFLLKNHLHGHDFSARIVGGMAGRGQINLIIVNSCLFGSALVNSGGSCGHVKNFDH